MGRVYLPQESTLWKFYSSRVYITAYYGHGNVNELVFLELWTCFRLLATKGRQVRGPDLGGGAKIKG